MQKKNALHLRDKGLTPFLGLKGFILFFNSKVSFSVYLLLKNVHKCDSVLAVLSGRTEKHFSPVIKTNSSSLRWIQYYS